MKKQGAIILGIGGDNTDGAVGTFYEGVTDPSPRLQTLNASPRSGRSTHH